jgi:hypothetical protein
MGLGASSFAATGPFVVVGACDNNAKHRTFALQHYCTCPLAQVLTCRRQSERATRPVKRGQFRRFGSPRRERGTKEEEACFTFGNRDAGKTCAKAPAAKRGCG